MCLWLLRGRQNTSLLNLVHAVSDSSLAFNSKKISDKVPKITFYVTIFIKEGMKPDVEKTLGLIEMASLKCATTTIISRHFKFYAAEHTSPITSHITLEGIAKEKSSILQEWQHMYSVSKAEHIMRDPQHPLAVFQEGSPCHKPGRC